MKILNERLFPKLIEKTNFFRAGYYPGLLRQGAYDLMEQLMPTLAVHFGGDLKNLSRWNGVFNAWSGNYKKYPVRWKNEVEEYFTDTCILHPAKKLDNPVRQFNRMKRNRNGAAN